MMNKFGGLGVALITPFGANGEIDFDALSRLLDHCSAVDYFVVLGTTGETATMNAKERDAVVRHVVKCNAGRKPIVVGLGGNNTAETIIAMQSFDMQGVDAILSVVPYYNKPNQEGIFQHFSAIADASPLPIVLYNIPGRSGVNMTAETTLRLAHKYSGKIVAIKEASGNLSQAAYIIRDKPADFAVISGDDNLALAMIAIGGEGVISVSANAFAPTVAKIIHSALDGDFRTAAEVNLSIHELVDLLFVEGNPCGVKCVLKQKKVIENYLRLPLVPASKALEEKLKTEIEKRNF